MAAVDAAAVVGQQENQEPKAIDHHVLLMQSKTHMGSRRNPEKLTMLFS